MKKSYTVVIERDTESTWLVGEVVELPGCYTQAPNLPTLELNIQEWKNTTKSWTIFNNKDISYNHSAMAGASLVVVRRRRT